MNTGELRLALTFVVTLALMPVVSVCVYGIIGTCVNNMMSGLGIEEVCET